MKKVSFTLGFCLVLGLVWFYTGQAQDEPKYIGSEVCSTCHADSAKTWMLTVHRRTLFNKDPAQNGCEACHGPGGAHVAAGGDKSKIIRLSSLNSEQVAAICQKCHTQEKVTLWSTSRHARSKLTCINCHDPHSPGEKSLLADVENAKLAAEGIARAVKQAELAAKDAQAGSKDKTVADETVAKLKAEKEKLQKDLKGAETAYQRTVEPYICFSCHKPQEVQSKMPSHHPIAEGKVKCSDCHNPHGGPNGMLNQETVIETCRKCHAEKTGPFVFEHPAVTEDCLNCHNPHGSVQNKLLVQNEPFLCMKCHTGTHAARGDVSRFAQRYTTCTNCHTLIHGSDTHAALFE